MKHVKKELEPYFAVITCIHISSFLFACLF